MNIQREQARDATTIVTELIDDFVAALVNGRIYSSQHPRFRASLDAVGRLVRELATLTGEDPVHIATAEDLVIYQKRPLLAATLSASRFIALLRQWGSGGIELASSITTEALSELIAGLSARPLPGEDYQTVNARLEQHRVPRTCLLPPYVDGTGAGGGRPGTCSRLHTAVRFYQTIVDLLQTVTIGVCSGGHIEFDPVKSMAEQMLLRLESDEGPLLSLARQDQYDAFTFGHSVRVAVLAMTFAKSLTEDRDLVTRIGVAALLHDVGKALIPFEILHVQRRLTPEEFRAMQQHPQLGAELLLDHHDSDPLSIAAAFGHHETSDGRGYPETLHSYHTSIVTEIVKICDVYEALTAARPYKSPMSPVKAYRVMLAMANTFDRGLLRRFVETNGVFPIGQAVRLSTGEVAVVRRQGEQVLRPIVEVMTDATGQVLADDDRQIFDLADIDCVACRSILGEVAAPVAGQVCQSELMGTAR